MLHHPSHHSHRRRARRDDTATGLPADGMIWVRHWHDPLVESLGHCVQSTYVEEFWLPVLGPTATWLVRMLARDLAAAPSGYRADLAEIAGRLGVSWSPTAPSTLARAIERTVMFGACALHDDPAVLDARLHLAPVPRRHLARMPRVVQWRHDAVARGARTLG